MSHSDFKSELENNVKMLKKNQFIEIKINKHFY